MTTPPPMNPPAAQPEGPKKTPIWVWILAAVGGMIVLGIIAISLLGYYAFQKVKEVADSPTAAAALLAKIDPDLEVLEVDEKKKVIRVRSKKDNEELTLNMADILQGKLKVSKEGKDGVESFELGGQVKLPSWLPAYPGANPKGIGAASSKDGEGGVFGFESADAPEKILAFYREGLTKKGFLEKEQEEVKAAAAFVLSMKSESEGVSITVTPSGSNSQVTVVYGGK